MKIHEYQGKQILKSYNIPIQDGVVVENKEDIESAIDESNLIVGSVLSGNRNFEGRIHQKVKANYLASPPLVVAYALAGTLDIDLFNDPIGKEEAYTKDESLNIAMEVFS